MSFFQLGDMSVIEVLTAVSDRFSATTKDTVVKSIKQCSAVDFNIDVKLPYIVIPELGTLQK